MNLSPFLKSAVITLLLFYMCCGVVWCTDQTSNSITFRYNPPLDKEYWLVSEQDKVTELGQVTQKSHGFSLSRLVFSKDSEGLYLRNTADSVLISKDGVIIQDPFVNALAKTDQFLRLDSVGTLLSAKLINMDTLIKQLGLQDNSDMMKRIMSLISPEAIYKKVKEEWSASVEQFSGRTLNIGDTLVNESDFPLPTGSIMHFSGYTVLDSLCKCGGQSQDTCVSIHYYSTASDSGSLQVKDSTNYSTTTQIASGTMILDPKTLISYSERRTREIQMKQFGIKPSSSVMRETRTAKLSWSKP